MLGAGGGVSHRAEEGGGGITRWPHRGKSGITCGVRPPRSTEFNSRMLAARLGGYTDRAIEAITTTVRSLSLAVQRFVRNGPSLLFYLFCPLSVATQSGAAWPPIMGPASAAGRVGLVLLLLPYGRCTPSPPLSSSSATANCSVALVKSTSGTCSSSRYGCRTGDPPYTRDAVVVKRGCCGEFVCDGRYNLSCCSRSHSMTTVCPCGPAPPTPAGGTYHVVAGAPRGGDGSKERPFAAIQTCVEVAAAARVYKSVDINSDHIAWMSQPSALTRRSPCAAWW